MKTAQERLNDTKVYLQAKLSAQDYAEVLTLLNGKSVATVSSAISVGNSNPFQKTARRAKRGAMLLAHLLIDDQTMRTAELLRLKGLSESSEDKLLNEVKSWFTRNAISPDFVASHAKNTIDKMPNWNNQNIDASDAVRGVFDKGKTFNCYNGCVFWAFQAGVISKRYLWNKLQGKDGNTFYPTYSAVGWDILMEFAPDGTVTRDVFARGDIIVPAGMTVYFETPSKVFGHVALSLGDGNVISQNSVLAPPSEIAKLSAGEQVEFMKMAHAETHIVSIRSMVDAYFNGANGYIRLNVSFGPFWSTILPAER